MGLRYGQMDCGQGVVDVLNEIFGEGKFDLDFIHWMASCPTGPNRWYAAFDGDRPVGTYGLLPMLVDVDGVWHTAALCHSVGTVPSHRGKGIFTALGKYAVTDMNVGVVLGVPNDAAVPGHRKVGWRQYGRLEMLTGNGGGGWCETKRLESWMNFRYVPPFKQQDGGFNRFSVVRNQKLMQWRYSKPGHEYVQSMYPDGRYVIWKERDGHKQVMETNDWEIVPNMDGPVDVLQLKWSKVWHYLSGMLFDSLFGRDLMMYTDIPVEPDVNAIRFEACDFDLL